MENLIEKLKGLDKKVWIGIGIGAAALIILIVVLLIGSGNSKPSGSTQGSSQGNSQVGTQAGTQAGTEGIGTENLGTEVLGTEMTTEIETEIGTETEMTESESESQSQSQGGGNQSNNNQGGTTTTPGVGGTTVTQPEDVNGVEQKPVTTTPEGEEILGQGSKDSPLEEIPDSENGALVLSTIEVPAGKTVYYLVQRIGGMYLNIDDPDLYIIDSAGKRHDSGYVVEDAMANENVLIQVGNKSNTNKSFNIRFTNLGGTYQNPEIITALEGSKSFKKGNDKGWYYKYTATQNGTVRFYITYTKESDLVVTNLNTSAVRNFTSDASGKEYIEVKVSAGDELLIQICAMPDKRWNYPATDITWRGEYVTQ